MCKWSSQRMATVNVQNLWNKLDESYSPNIILRILQGQWSAIQVLTFALNFQRRTEFFIKFGRRSHNLGARDKRPKGRHLNFSCL